MTTIYRADHIGSLLRPQEVLDARHLTNNEITMMHYELQIERGESFARPAWTRCPGV